jgi:hypothetical protein
MTRATWVSPYSRAKGREGSGHGGADAEAGNGLSVSEAADGGADGKASHHDRGDP